MSDHPKDMTNRPDSVVAGHVDALSDVLRTVHLKGSVYYRSELRAPWGMAVPRSQAAQFHVVRSGQCCITIAAETEETAVLQAGDLVVLSRGSAHRLGDSADSATPPIEEILCGTGRKPGDCHTPLRYGGDGPGTVLICGYFEFESGTVHPLLAVLPAVILLRGRNGQPPPWLAAILGLLEEEVAARRPGAEIVMNRLTETMLIQVIRAHLATAAASGAGWLGGLTDAHIGQALGLIHRQPGESWTLDSLAASVGMSRSGFAERFRSLVGEPPLQYLTRWRMEIAATHLKRGELSLGQIAEKVGYQAEPAFSRVFKKLWGVGPGAFRRTAGNRTSGREGPPHRMPATVVPVGY